MTVVFWLDIVLNFRTTYIDSSGEEIFSNRAVIKTDARAKNSASYGSEDT